MPAVRPNGGSTADAAVAGLDGFTPGSDAVGKVEPDAITGTADSAPTLPETSISPAEAGAVDADASATLPALTDTDAERMLGAAGVKAPT